MISKITANPTSSDLFRILLVEDNPGDARLIREMLSEGLSRPFTLDLVGSLSAGLEHVEENGIDVVILDLGLPDSRGIPTLEAFQSCRSKMPIVVLTGYDDDRAGLEAVKKGAQDYLLKGEVNPHSLTRSLRYAIERSHLLNLLHAAESRLRTIIEATADSILVLGQDGRVRYMNSAARTFFSPEADDLLNGAFEDPLRPGLTTELEVTQEDGQTIIGEMRVGNTDWGEESVFLISVHDITQRKRIEEELKQHRDHLEELVAERTAQLRKVQEELLEKEKLANLGQVAAAVAHELRNPLGVINNVAYFLKSTHRDADEKVKDYFGMLEEEVYNAQSILSSLLEYAHTAKPNVSETNLQDVVERVLHTETIPETVSVHVGVAADAATAFVDGVQIQEALGNVVRNAWQSMEGGGLLTIKTDVNGACVSLCVCDTGRGITAEALVKVFDPMYSTKNRAIGLGLAVAKRLVEGNGGRIEVASEPGRGTVVTFRLPLFEQESKTPRGEDAPSP